jgi:hypothetical protein
MVAGIEEVPAIECVRALHKASSPYGCVLWTPVHTNKYNTQSVGKSPQIMICGGEIAAIWLETKIYNTNNSTN